MSGGRAIPTETSVLLFKTADADDYAKLNRPHPEVHWKTWTII